jgi:hypothetical protein
MGKSGSCGRGWRLGHLKEFLVQVERKEKGMPKKKETMEEVVDWTVGVSGHVTMDKVKRYLLWSPEPLAKRSYLRNSW